MQVTNFYTSTVTNLMNNDVNNEYITSQMTFPDFTRHFFSSLAETVDSCFVVVLNR